MKNLVGLEVCVPSSRLSENRASVCGIFPTCFHLTESTQHRRRIDARARARPACDLRATCVNFIIENFCLTVRTLTMTVTVRTLRSDRVLTVRLTVRTVSVVIVFVFFFLVMKLGVERTGRVDSADLPSLPRSLPFERLLWNQSQF